MKIVVQSASSATEGSTATSEPVILPFRCPSCPRAFASVMSLRAHQNSHRLARMLDAAVTPPPHRQQLHGRPLHQAPNPAVVASNQSTAVVAMNDGPCYYTWPPASGYRYDSLAADMTRDLLREWTPLSTMAPSELATSPSPLLAGFAPHGGAQARHPAQAGSFPTGIIDLELDLDLHL